MWYDPDGNPISIQAAEALLRDIRAKQVAATQLVTNRGIVRVSTVFLVLDHNHGDDGPPVLWETMVFGGPLDDHQWRYRSREDAVAGHAEAVTWARTALDLEGVAVMADETVGNAVG